MSAADKPVDVTTQKSAAKKKRKNKKKANGKQEEKGLDTDVNGVKNEIGAGGEDEDDEDELNAGTVEKGTLDTLDLGDSSQAPPSGTASSSIAQESPTQNGLHSETSAQQDSDIRISEEENLISQIEERPAQSDSTDTSARLDAMQQERDSLRAEVTHLRQQLELLQQGETGDSDVTELRKELEDTRQGKEHAETQYRNLLGKVNTIRSQLGERLKADAEELEQVKGEMEQLESKHSAATTENARLQASISQLNTELESQASEMATLRSRTNLSASNWAKEREELASTEATLRKDYEVAKQAMQDWEILATEERARREALEDRSQELEEQLDGQGEAYERVKDEAKTQSSTVDGLQRALRDLQEERRRELRDMVEQSQTQLDELRKQAKNAEDAAADLKQQLEATEKELERALPYEKEVREKNLLIGKLRHEAVILNDHLTKALRFLKRGKPEDNVDRQLVTNHLMQFLALDRSDVKKFQVLQLIAALLGWSEEQREQAGLLRQGSITGTGSLKLPVSPFRRTPSTPSLSTDFMPDSAGSASKESLAELWSEFLERESDSVRRNRTGSTTGSLRSPSWTGVTSPSANDDNISGILEAAKPKRKESVSSIVTASNKV